jgi:glycine cleavage system H lipoate-binding protein
MNNDPTGNGWLYKMKVLSFSFHSLFIVFLSFSFSQLTNLDEFENLMDEGAYAKHCEEEEKHH